MQVSGINNLYNGVTQHASQPTQSGGSFNDYLIGSGDDAVKEFMDYMKQTPAQQMFASFLSSHHISQSQYDAMSPEQKEALTKQFQQELKQQMGASSHKNSSIDFK